jgi:hypothetical protein
MFFAKAFAGVLGKSPPPQSWGKAYRGLAVAAEDVPGGRLWRFGRAHATAPLAASGVVIGRPFVDTVGPLHLVELTAIRRVLAQLDGRFCLCTRLEGGTTVLATDWLGQGPLFYGALNGAVYFASHLGLLLSMLEGLPPLDQLGLASMLGGTTLIGGRTPHQGIRRLMAGEMAVIGPGASDVKVERYADPADILAQDAAPGGAPADAFSHYLQVSLARESLSGDGLTLMLTGGKDSTALAYGLVETGRRDFRTATFGRRYCRDVVLARHTARALGLPHRRIPYEHWTLHGEADFVAAISGGSAGLQTSHNIVGYRDIGDQADTAMVGFLGDAITGAHLGPRSLDRLGLSFTRNWHPPFEEMYAEELAALRNEMEGYARDLSTLAPHQRLLLLDFTVRQATWISQTFSLCNWWIDLSTPFCHRDLIRFLFNLPEQEIEHQRFYTRWLAQTGKRLREERPSLGERLIDAERLARRAMTRFLGTTHPDSTVDWTAMQRASMSWLEKTISGYHEDTRLKALATTELQGLKSSKPPLPVSPLLFAASIMLARQSEAKSAQSFNASERA